MLKYIRLFLLCTYILAAVGFLYSIVNPYKNTLYIGVDIYSAPFCITTSAGELKGFNIDVAYALGKALDSNIEFRILPLTSLHKNLIKGTIDAVIVPFNANNEKNTQNVLLSNTYYTNGLSYLNFKDQPLEIDSISETKGINICVLDKPFVLNFVRQNYYNANILIYKSSSEATRALYKKDCTVIVDTRSSNEYFITKHRLNRIKSTLIDNAKAYHHEYKIAVRNNAHELAEEINRALNYLDATGQLERIHKKWFGTSRYENTHKKQKK